MARLHNFAEAMPLSILLLIGAALLCALTTGLVLAFAVVVMPGLRTLPDRDFLRAFKAIDRVIQDNAPLFLIVWVGSIVLLLVAGAVNLGTLGESGRLLLVVAGVTYLAGVQGPTFAVNVPLNNQLQATDLDELGAEELAQARAAFEPRWVFWNAARTAAGVVATSLLFGVLYTALIAHPHAA